MKIRFNNRELQLYRKRIQGQDEDPDRFRSMHIESISGDEDSFRLVTIRAVVRVAWIVKERERVTL